MIPSALRQEIESLRNQGKPDGQIKLELIKAGWPKITVDNAFLLPPQVNSITPQPTNIQTPIEPILATPTEEITDSHQIVNTVNTAGNNYNFFQKILSGEKKFRVFLVGLLIGVITSVYPSYMAISYALPFVNTLEEKVRDVIDDVFPDELEIIIENGRARTNVTEPYHLTISQSTLENFINEEHSQDQPISRVRILTLNTSGKIEDYEQHQSLAMLTAQNLVYYNDEGIQVNSLSSVPNMEIDKQFLYEKISEYNRDQKFVNFFRVIIYLTPVFIIFGVALLFVAEVLFGAFLIWIINKIMKAELKFSNIYGLMGSLAFIPYLLLMNIRLVPFLQAYYLWLNTFFDVVILSVGYVLIKSIKKT